MRRIPQFNSLSLDNDYTDYIYKLQYVILSLLISFQMYSVKEDPMGLINELSMCRLFIPQPQLITYMSTCGITPK